MAVKTINEMNIESHMQHTFPVDVGRKPPTISFLAVSWTAVAPRDLNKRLTYLLSEALEPCRGSTLGGGTEAPVCDVSRWPQVLHFVSFDLLGTKSVQVHVALSCGDPVQAIGTVRGRRKRGGVREGIEDVENEVKDGEE